MSGRFSTSWSTVAHERPSTSDMKRGDKVIVTYHMNEGRTFRHGTVVGENGLGDIHVEYGNGLQVTCRREHVHAKRVTELGRACLPGW